MLLPPDVELYYENIFPAAILGSFIEESFSGKIAGVEAKPLAQLLLDQEIQSQLQSVWWQHSHGTGTVQGKQSPGWLMSPESGPNN